MPIPLPGLSGAWNTTHVKHDTPLKFSIKNPITPEMSTCLQAVALLLVSHLALAAQPTGSAKEPPVADPALESRLEIEKLYRTKHGDTLRSVARLLYGHDTWWSKIQQMNPGMRGINPDWQLPQDTRIKYLAARVGKEYVVQPGDWLIRIATWKYGDTSEWEKVYRDNASAISNPNLIHPGDRLVFNADGTVFNKTTQQTVLNGLPQETQQPAARIPASAPPPEPEGFGVPAWFAWGLLAGLIALYFLVPRRRLAPAAAEPPAWLSLDTSALDDDGAEDGEPLPEKFDEIYQEMTRDGYYRTFRRRPIEEYKIDKSLVPYETGNEARPSGYHLIMPKKLKKYLGLKKRR